MREAQTKVQEIQQKLTKIRATGEAGAGAVKATVDGHKKILKLDIDEEFYFKPDAGLIMISPADETPTRAVDAQPEDFDVAMGVHHHHFENAFERIKKKQRLTYLRQQRIEDELKANAVRAADDIQRNRDGGGAGVSQVEFHQDDEEDSNPYVDAEPEQEHWGVDW